MVGRTEVTMLSKRDRIILQNMLEREKRRSIARPRSKDGFAESEDHQSALHYIAYAPASGIPALAAESQAGTGTVIGPGGDLPGSALCDIYKIVNGVLVGAGFQKRVWNLTDSDIAGTWLTVTKDPFGSWIANVGGGTTMLVKITELGGYGTSIGTGLGTGTGTSASDPVAIYRTSHPTGFNVIALDQDHNEVGAEFLCYADELVNVHYTDAIVRITRFGSKWQIVTTGENNWEDAFTAEAIDVDTSVGTAPETVGNVQMFSNGPVVQAGTSFQISIHTFCQLRFDNQAQKFRIGDQACTVVSNSGTA